MCNEIKCAIQYTVDLINNNINRDVQRNVQTARRMCKHGCTGYVHIKLSPVNVMRPSLSLSLGAWWPEGRSSFSVSQFLPSCS